MTNADRPAGDSHLLTAIDAAAVAAIGLAICLASRRLWFMTILVPLVVAARCSLVALAAKRERVNLAAEFAFLAICTLLGAFNDWNSVVHHRIYDYTVPHFFAWTTIPLWMLLYWGLILRFVARLARWRALAPPAAPVDVVRFGRRTIVSGMLKVALLLALVALTRQAIYRWYLHPVLSWLPFAAALFVYGCLFPPDRHDRRLLGLFLVGGPATEILFIQLGGLHYYHLGWLGGVPLWIALWWLLIVLIWKDLSLRVERLLLRLFQPRQRIAAPAKASTR